MYFIKAQKNPKYIHTAPHFTAQAESTEPTDNKPNVILHLDTYCFPDDTTYDSYRESCDFDNYEPRFQFE